MWFEQVALGILLLSIGGAVAYGIGLAIGYILRKLCRRIARR